ncbi:hypothetical protein J6590_059143 [Homalodisca vitripennis]|nr:hypothetical protein J6590_059143 [Homalodisca vitripennis]
MTLNSPVYEITLKHPKLPAFGKPDLESYQLLLASCICQLTFWETGPVAADGDLCRVSRSLRAPSL